MVAQPLGHTKLVMVVTSPVRSPYSMLCSVPLGSDLIVSIIDDADKKTITKRWMLPTAACMLVLLLISDKRIQEETTTGLT